MTAVKARFNGQQIEVPPELLRASPGDVLIVYNESSVAPTNGAAAPSIWDAFGKAPVAVDAAELDARLRAERDSWGER